MKSELELAFHRQIKWAGLPEPEFEYLFATEALKRRWRFDVCWPNQRLAVELDGGIWTQGRHTRALGFMADCVKHNAAQELGWRVLRYTAAQVQGGEALEQTRRMLERGHDENYAG